jgi:Ricin-type beta-trefoil lectin domain/Putative Ig domain
MRKSIRASRSRLLAAAVGVLLAGSATAAVMLPAGAAVSPVTISNPGTQDTHPLGSAVDVKFTAADTDATGLPLTFSSTTLPAGLAINATTGEITGTATTPFDNSVTVTATDQNAAKATATFDWTVENVITVTNPGLQSSPVGTAITPLHIVAADDAGVGATLTYGAGGLPAGLTIDTATGIISGTPTTVGPATVTVTVSDGTESPAGGATFAWKVTNQVTVDAPTTEQSLQGVPITPVTISATSAPTTLGVTYGFTATGLPAGLKINAATGVISGTPTAAPATYAATVKATDSTGGVGTALIEWKIGKQNTIDVTAPATKLVYLGVKMSLQLKATDAVTSLKTFTWTTNGLPAGLTIGKTTGLISGRPTKGGTFKTVVTATDSTLSRGVATITWRVTGAVAVINLAPKLKTTTVGQGLDIQFKVTDKVAGEKLSFAAAGLPPGMYLSQKPLMLWGWPTKSGTFSALVKEKGSLGTSATTKVPLTVKPATGKGASGFVYLVFNRKCLQSPSGSKVEITNCIPGSTENWTVATDGTIRVRGGCLDISGSSGYLGKSVILARCNGSVREKWAQGTRGLIVNPASGLCLTDPNGSSRNGTVPTMASCKVTAAKQWNLPALPVLAPVGGFCADDYFSLGYDGSKVDLFSCNGTRGQAWLFKQDGTIRQSQYPLVCLTVHGTLGKAGVKVLLYKCQKNDKQQAWTVTSAGGLSSEISLGGVCLGIPALTSPNGTGLVTAKCGKTNPTVLWHIQ